MPEPPNKPGRPHIDPENPLNQRVIVRLSRQDMTDINRCSGLAKLSTFLRGLIREGLARLKNKG